MNVISLSGRVHDTPVRKDTKDGVVTELVLAIDGKNRQWIMVEAWGRLAGTCAQHLTTGRRIAVTGELRSRRWISVDGASNKSWFVRGNDVTFLDSPPTKSIGQTTRVASAAAAAGVKL